MNQQINLYQQMFRKQRQPLAAQTLLLICLLACVGLMLFYGYARWQLGPAKEEWARLQAEQSSASAQLETLTGQIKPPEKDPLLEQEIISLSAELAAKQQLLNSSTSGVFGNSEGFSTYLEGLAQQRVEGMWLTGVNISAGGTELELAGSTLEPKLVLAFLQQLSRAPAFAGREFKTLAMDRSEADTAKIDFKLRTGEAASSEPDAE